MKKEYSEEEALCKVAALCSASEYCVRQITDKLTKWGVPAEVRERIIDRLLEEKYVDEERFAGAYTRDKVRYDHWGRTKISLYLHRMGIGDALIRRAMEQIPKDEYDDILQHLLQAKARTIKASSEYERKGKLIKFALGRGFTFDEVRRHLGDVDAYEE